jgi:hypothetical protein
VAKRKTNSAWIYEKLEEIHKDIKEVREKDIPTIKVEVAEVKVKTSLQAKIVTGVGGLVAVGISTAIALIK